MVTVDPSVTNSLVAILFLLGLLVLDRLSKAMTGKPLTAWLGKARKDADAMRETVDSIRDDLRSIKDTASNAV